MARLESVALGGYFKTPTHLIPRIAPLLAKHVGSGEVTFLDPCAGEGEAILGLIKLLCPLPNAHLYACEMEESRAKTLIKASQAISQHLGKSLIHGDAFRVTFNKEHRDGISILFLNPPYDTDRVHGRLEQKFLSRFTPVLMQDGVLIFVVPFYALAASAQHIASEYHNIHCFKFPDEDFAAYKQVVLFAQKGPSLLEPDPNIVAQVEAYARSAAALPELPTIITPPLAAVPSSENYHQGLEKWELRALDLTGLLQKTKPWQQSTRGGAYAPVHGILPDLPIQDLLLRKYPVATPPRPAHIAAGIAAGIFNGSRVEPTDPSLGLPELLVKGVFDQEYRTVEEKYNPDSGKTTLVQVQQPRLVATVLDLKTRKYHTLGTTAGQCPATIDKLTVSGLLAYYGDSLMRVMEQQCPVLYDPRRDRDKVTLAETARKPYVAQADAAKALVMLLGGNNVPLRRRTGKAMLLGEIGSGKSTVSLVVSKTVGAKRPIIICPPHLLTSWTNEVAAVLPEAEVRILEDVGSLQALDDDTSDKTIVSVVSRETAKLSHGWVSVGALCPKCGQATPTKSDLAKTRARCEVRPIVAEGPIAAVVRKLSQQLMRFAPQNSTVRWLLRGPWDQKRIEFYREKRKKQPLAFPGFTPSYFDEALMALLPRFGEGEKVKQAIVWALLCTGNEDRIAGVAEHFLKNSGYYEGDFGRALLLMLPPNGPRQVELVAKYRDARASYGWNPWSGFEKLVEATQVGEPGKSGQVAGLALSWKDGVLSVRDVPARSLDAAESVLYSLSNLAGFQWGETCNEFLFQAIPDPRRVPLAQHILRHHSATFDFLIVDEAHEYGTEGSAQERAAHRLTELGLPTIEMTGSVMNGYAESLFMNMWSLSPAFREEFKRSDKQRFNDRYGYRKRIVTEKDDRPSNVVAFGSQSDRVETSERIVGNAPGVLPLFLLRHLLPISVTLHKSDLALDLPPCIQSKHLVAPTPEQLDRYQKLRDELVKQIREDQFEKDLAGKLFGQLAELPSYLDRCTADTGNTEGGEYQIRYPESLGHKLVAMQVPFAASEVMPKEQWMLDEIEAELAEGRNVMVFSWHVALLPRLARLISERIGEKVPILYANKVPTAKRQDWITKQVVQKGARVMVTNPVAIQTGLNNLVHFATELWMENPACNPIIYRQATGRVDRIGQLLETRIKFAVYAGTLQEALYDLLLQKVAVSISTDGLDPESALLAAGVGAEDFLTGLSIGKQLWAMLSSGTPKTKGPVYRPKPRGGAAPVSIFELMDGVD